MRRRSEIESGCRDRVRLGGFIGRRIWDLGSDLDPTPTDLRPPSGDEIEVRDDEPGGESALFKANGVIEYEPSVPGGAEVPGLPSKVAAAKQCVRQAQPSRSVRVPRFIGQCRF